MGYADTLPYQQITLRTGTRSSAMNITTVAQDFDIANFVIPDFKRPISNAYLSIHINNILNNDLSLNHLQLSGSWGIKDSGGTYQAIQGVENYACLVQGDFCSTGEYILTSTADVKAYITPGATQMARFEDIKAFANSIDIHNTWARLDLYFIG